MDCRLFAVGDILDVGASHGGCELDVLVSGAGCVPHRDDWASDGGQPSPVLARITGEQMKIVGKTVHRMRLQYTSHLSEIKYFWSISFD